MKTDDPVSSNVRYTGEIVRIFDRKCAPCHGADSLAVPLVTYRDVRDWGRAIREEIVEQRMPPWTAARGYVRFRNELALSAREATTILSWLDGGMPRGDDRDLPRPSTPSQESVDRPDLHLALPPQAVPAREDHVIRRVVLETNLESEETVERLIVNPDQRAVLRGVLVFAGDAEASGQWIGGWLPWQRGFERPAGNGVRLPPRARLTVELHYRGGERAISDSPTIDLFFDEPRSTRRSSDDVIVRAGTPMRLAKTTAVWAIVPAGDSSTTSLELTAHRPTGAVDTLLWMPAYRHEWPQLLALQDAVTLPAGTTLTLSAEPGPAAASARLSLMTASDASRASRLRTRTPAPLRR